MQQSKEYNKKPIKFAHASYHNPTKIKSIAKGFYLIVISFFSVYSMSQLSHNTQC